MNNSYQIFGRLIVLMLVVFVAGCSTVAVEAPEPVQGKGDTPEAAESEAKEEPPKNSLKWTTASEVENFGFDIFRSETEEGPFEKMTEDPLAGAGTTDEPQSYVWEDFDIETGKDYFYYIESISMSGVRERFSPIIKAPAK